MSGGGFGPPLLIDADMMLYKAAAACEREVLWDDVNHVLFSNRDEAWDAVERQIATYRSSLGNGKMFFALTGRKNFRYDVLPDYKAKRGRKPLCYGYITEKLEAEYPCTRQDNIEADDLLGIWATGGKVPNSIIVSGDKDLKTIPGRVYVRGELIEVSQFDADHFWMTQVLTGDIVDGYKGLPGCGAVGAKKILDGKQDVVEMWDAVLKAYVAKGLTYDDAILQARMARILRSSDWNSETKEPILWEPK